MEISLEEYKNKVQNYLIQNLKHSKTTVKKMMNEYDIDFPMFLEEDWSVQETAMGMELGY